MLRILKINIPVFLVYLVAFLYDLGIFRAFEAVREVRGGPEAMFLVGLLTKVSGNKLQIYLLKNSKAPLWFSDLMVFFYEFMTALLIRVMLLTIPDENSAMVLSVLNVTVELMTRAWFFVAYVSKGAKDQKDQSKIHSTKEMISKRQWAFMRRGQMRVMDGNNDMVLPSLMSFLPSPSFLRAPSFLHLPSFLR